MKTTTKVKKWGNSLAVRIPHSIAQDLGLAVDSNVRLTSNGKTVVVKPQNVKNVSLKQLLDKVTPENIHQETDWGKPVGKEVW
jgi:antitoxin MazE